MIIIYGKIINQLPLMIKTWNFKIVINMKNIIILKI